MKKITVSILILLMITQAFSKWLLIAEFAIYRNYISKNLCENRYRPQLHCNGKCVFMKKMAAGQNDAPAGTPMPKITWETSVYIDDHIMYTAAGLPRTSLNFPRHNYLRFSSAFFPRIFRPPLV